MGELEDLIKLNQRVWKETKIKCEEYKVVEAEMITTLNVPVVDARVDKHVMVLEENMLEIAMIASNKGMKPLLINMGNANEPITPTKQGAIGPEFDLYRCSTMSKSINVEKHYPLIRSGDSNGAIRSLYSSVSIIKDVEYNHITPCSIGVLTIAPTTRPQLITMSSSESYKDESERTRMYECIERMFQVATAKGHKCIIVNDFGCQKSHGHPIADVIGMFNVAIAKYPIRYVLFSIMEPVQEQSAAKAGKKSGYKNYVMFNSGIKRY